MKYLKATELVSFGVFIAIVGIIMGWYATRTDVPVKQPSHISRQFFT